MNDKVKTKRMHIHMPEHLKNQVKSASNYYGITQVEFIKDAIKVAVMDFNALKQFQKDCFEKANGAMK